MLKEAFLAVLLSAGANANDQHIKLVEVIKPLPDNVVENVQPAQRIYVPAITADDTRTENKPHITRYAG